MINIGSLTPDEIKNISLIIAGTIFALAKLKPKTATAKIHDTIYTQEYKLAISKFDLVIKELHLYKNIVKNQLKCGDIGRDNLGYEFLCYKNHVWATEMESLKMDFIRCNARCDPDNRASCSMYTERVADAIKVCSVLTYETKNMNISELTGERFTDVDMEAMNIYVRKFKDINSSRDQFLIDVIADLSGPNTECSKFHMDALCMISLFTRLGMPESIKTLAILNGELDDKTFIGHTIKHVNH